MKVTLTGAEFAATAGWICRMVPAKTPVPVLSGVLLSADDDGLRMRATDFDTYGQVRAKAVTRDHGEALVSGRLLGAVAKVAAKSSDVEIVCDGPVCTVTAGRSSWTLPTIPKDEYPTWAEAGDAIAQIDGAVFAAALARVLPAADKEGKSPLHCGVLLTGGEDLIVTTTDRYRLGDATVAWTPVGDTDVELQLGAPLLEFASKTGGSGPVTIGTTGQMVSFASETHTIVGRMLAEELPRMRQLIPTSERPGWATIDVAELVDAINSANAVADTGMPLRMEFTEEELTLSLAETIGQSVAAVPVTGCGGTLPAPLYLKAQYVLDAIRCCGSEQVWFGFDTTPTRPVLVLPLGDDGEPEPGYTHLVMGRKPPAGQQ